MSYSSKTYVFCERSPMFMDMVRFWIKRVVEDSNGTSIFFAKTAEMVKSTESGMMVQPALELHPEQAQQFMDELWRVGFRPTEGTGSAGSLAATERHLADMRQLVFKTKPTK